MFNHRLALIPVLQVSGFPRTLTQLQYTSSWLRVMVTLGQDGDPGLLDDKYGGVPYMEPTDEWVRQRKPLHEPR